MSYFIYAGATIQEAERGEPILVLEEEEHDHVFSYSAPYKEKYPTLFRFRDYYEDVIVPAADLPQVLAELDDLLANHGDGDEVITRFGETFRPALARAIDRGQTLFSLKDY
ncbi:MAG: hypothetical protein KC466_06800 [Myxococcales bacterium]|nr:hypothetical protein [Myxococcales bacterium]